VSGEEENFDGEFIKPLNIYQIKIPLLRDLEDDDITISNQKNVLYINIHYAIMHLEKKKKKRRKKYKYYKVII